MTFESTRNGTVGEDRLRIDVYKPDGEWLERISIDRSHDPGRIYTLSNGLELSLGAGDLRRNDTFTLEVSAATGAVADPDQSFNGTRTEDANLEDGLDVTAGSFVVNGESITVAADDSINAVLAKINASAAEVTATYSALTELVTLTHDTPGSGGSVLVENDTSGFLAATKLTGTSFVAGRDDDLDTVLSDVPRFAGITAGDFTINGIAIAIDPGLDTLRDMIERINASSAGVTASIDATGRYFSLVADDPAEQLILDDNGRGFFPALEIAASTYDPSEAGDGGSRMSRHRANQVSELFRDVAVAINDLFGIAIPGSEPGSWLEMVRTNLQNDISGFLEGNTKSDLARIGVKFDWQATGGRVARFSGQDQVTMRSALTRSPGSVANLFFADSANRDPGFIERLLATAEATDTALERALGFKGLQVDTYA